MSFILDALKKAEGERSRSSGPVLVDVRIAPPRRRLPAWAWVLGTVLVANLALLAWLLLRPHPTVPVTAQQAMPEKTPPSAQPAITMVPSQPAATVQYVTPAPALPAEPAPQPQAAIQRPATEPPERGRDISALPTARQLRAMGVSLPPLLMNLHAYDPSPSLRYVLLNGMRLAEGDFTPDGIKVETIVENGAVLEARGHRFLLPAGPE